MPCKGRGLTFQILLDLLSSSTVIDLHVVVYAFRIFGSLANCKYKKKNLKLQVSAGNSFLGLNICNNVLLSMNLQVQETKPEKAPRLCLNPAACQLDIFPQKRKLSG